ncbi:hypothetical protein JR316_0005948 [Psilocybe cubensis]|uniref:Uncharacterized protein n=2 Tax=Psilocybe cubensis TaxID=181762 RepID=A0ACB8H1B3_PSICU|nr:hypothetical protein JR316_0005948 [Psilocybe cubensis]KAH9481422.1 hypothetical protein JR316_0005948 [Psilocybe cubensis]
MIHIRFVATALLRICFVFGLIWVTNAQGARQYKIVNSCPSTVAFYIGGLFDSNLATGASTTKTLGVNAGFFYVFANGGNAIGTRAGFYGDNNSSYYYIVKDSAVFNTGISIAPNYQESGGFCPVARCDNVDCTNAFPQPPTRFPPVSNTPPTPPVYACPHSDVSFTITFCPSGAFPTPPSAKAIHPSASSTKCVDVRAANYANGTPVQIYDCNGTGAQKFVFNNEATKIQVAGTNFCLDAGTTPANGVGMKIWQCYDGLPAQRWYKSPNGQIILEGTAYCLDLTNGNLSNSNQLQIWQCYDGNGNQIWTQ